MMGIGPEEAGRLLLHDYQALTWHWHDRHKTSDDDDAEDIGPPDAAQMMERHRRIEARGFGQMVH